MKKVFKSLPVLLALALTLAFAIDASAQTAPYTRTVIVSSNGTPTANGTALVTAMVNTCNSRPVPAGHRWLIKLEPGIYDVGTTPVEMCPYVDLEGSGVLGSEIRGSVMPPAGFLIGGLVRGASNTEIRALTVNCLSNATTTSCQALSLDHASPRLTQMRILAQGSGTGGHWGIRTSNSAPILDDIEITVSANGANNYGIVYGDESTLNITRSNIHALNATSDNLAIVIKEELGWSAMRDSSVTASGGSRAMGISYLESFTTNPLFLDDVIVQAYGASGESIGIGVHSNSSPLPRTTVYLQGGRILGATDGVYFGFALSNVELKHTEVEASRYIAQADNARLYFVRVKGTGTVEGWSSEQCAATVDNAGAFLPNTCP